MGPTLFSYFVNAEYFTHHGKDVELSASLEHVKV